MNLINFITNFEKVLTVMFYNFLIGDAQEKPNI